MTLLLSLAPLMFVYVNATNTAADMLVASLQEDLKEKSFLVGADIDRYFSQREHDVRILSQADVLETDNEKNIGFYERVGFGIDGEISIFGVSVWRMRRSPSLPAAQ